MADKRKLRLDLQDLGVESFDSTMRPTAKRGTVVAHIETQVVNCYTFYDGCNYTPVTCQMSCPASCDATCPGGPTGCETASPTEELTCLDATCYWIGNDPFYDGGMC